MIVYQIVCKGLSFGVPNHFIFRFSSLYHFKIICLIPLVRKGAIFNVLRISPRLAVIVKICISTVVSMATI